MNGESASNGGATRRRIWTVVGITLTVIALVIVADLATASPRLCSSCHEMSVRTDSWEQSAHAAVACVECHQPARPVYAYPVKLADRARLLGRDIAAHASGNFEDPIDAPTASSKPVEDEVCLQCHDPNRKATSGFRIKIDHAEHAERNGSCVSCHVRTAHPIESRGTALSLMAQCYTCHGTAEQPDASAECDVCHPSGYELVPASHEPAEWKETHGEVADEDLALCEMCHEQDFCTDCHGVEMPHPDGWAKGRTGHAVVVAEKGREVCESCHGAQPDMCTMCHHTAYQPGQGTWEKQHFNTVREEGTAFCLSCHSPLFCVECHAAPPESR